MQLAFQQFGSGPPLLILHGLFGSSDNWQTISRALGERFHVFALDLRNHGRSPHSSEMTYSLLADDLREFIQQRLGHEPRPARVRLLGHSMGGKVAMQFALSFPEQVEKIVVVDMAPKLYPPRHDQIFDGLLGLTLDKVATRGEADAQLAASVPDQAVRAFLLKNLARDLHGRFYWKFNLKALAENYALLNGPISLSSRFEGPALFIRGELSDYLDAADFAQVREFFPNAILRTVPAAGHWVHAEQPKSFIKLALEFL
jgi:Predicted hydrolases or acyltransferases (alpha/beta hydrolase superfamily)